MEGVVGEVTGIMFWRLHETGCDLWKSDRGGAIFRDWTEQGMIF